VAAGAQAYAVTRAAPQRASPDPSPLRRELCGFESALVVAAFVVLMAVALHYMLGVFAAAERAYMTATVSHIRTALRNEALTRLVRRDYEGIAALAGSNPMEVAVNPPANYVGERAAPEPERIEGGHWYFDTEARTLVYRVEEERTFETPLEGPPRARFRVVLRYEDLDGDGAYDPGADAFQGVGLDALEPYRWRR